MNVETDGQVGGNGVFSKKIWKIFGSRKRWGENAGYVIDHFHTTI